MRIKVPSPLSSADITHRRQFEQFVLDNAEPWHRKHLGHIYQHWNECNEEFFDGMMLAPYIVLSSPTATRALGDCSPVSGFGGRSQIRIRRSLLTGTHPRILPGADQQGCLLYVFDVLLHEMIHQWQQEVTGIQENSYHGHGRGFRDKCNEIGRKLGLPPVGLKTRRGVLPLPNCAHWPSNVRPRGYYLGAVEEPTEVLTIAAREYPLASSDSCSEHAAPILRVEKIARVLLRVLSPNEIDDLIGLLRKTENAGECHGRDGVLAAALIREA